MGCFSHSVAGLGPPFLLIDEALFVVRKGGSMPLSRHHFKFLFILSGSVEHEIDGLGGRNPLKAGDILVAPIVRYHRYVNPNRGRATPVQIVRLFLDAEFLRKHSRRKKRSPETDFADYVLHHFPGVTHLRDGIDNEIAGLLTAVRREAEGRKSGHRHRVRSICMELIIAIVRKREQGTPAPARTLPLSGNLVGAAKEYIFKHFVGDMTLGEVAWHVGKSEEHLARVFKRETGQSVFDYVREIRINEAKTLLVNPALSLTEIAARCGFHSLSFFSRTFRQLSGVTPSNYRQGARAVVRRPG